jgi:chromosome segregation ATPase
MRQFLAVMTVSLLLGAAWIPSAQAEEEAGAARVREMLRRTQEALRQAQSDNADLTRARADAEQKLKAATQQLEAAQNGARAAAASLGAKLSTTESARAELERRFGSVSEQLAATSAKLTDTSRDLNERNAALAATTQSLELSKAANASCENKNLTLFSYSEEVLQQYKNKGVWAALAQKEPVFGLREVDVENVVQEYRMKFAAQKAKP